MQNEGYVLNVLLLEDCSPFKCSISKRTGTTIMAVSMRQLGATNLNICALECTEWIGARVTFRNLLQQSR